MAHASKKDLPVAAETRQLMPHIQRSLPDAACDGDLGQCSKVCAELIELARFLRRPQKLHHNDRTRRNLVGEEPGREVVVGVCGLFPVRPGARVCELHR